VTKEFKNPEMRLAAASTLSGFIEHYSDLLNLLH
jgi:hypothetical protein